MKECKWYEFHNWEEIYQPYERTFMGEICVEEYEPYKICKKCGVGYNQRWDEELSACQSKVLKSKITRVNGRLELPLQKLDKPKPPTEE